MYIYKEERKKYINLNLNIQTYVYMCMYACTHDCIHTNKYRAGP